MTTTNEKLEDLATQNQVFTLRFADSEFVKILRLFREAEKDLTERLRQRLDNLSDNASIFLRGGRTTARLQAILDAIKEINRQLLDSSAATFTEDMQELVNAQIEVIANNFDNAIGFETAAFIPDQNRLNAIVNGGVIRGQTLAQWWKDLETTTSRRLEAAVKLGVLEGDTTEQIVRRVKETTDLNRNSARALVRTSITAVSAQTRDAFAQENDDIIKQVKWVSTLDGRTSAICRSRDGNVYPVDSGPRPPAHPNCRSSITFVTKSWDELAQDGALKRGRGSTNFETLGRQNLEKAGKSPEEIDRIMNGTRASMTGQVPRSLTYETWLRRQPADFQKDVLGVEKHRAWKQGGVSLDKFVDQKSGREFTIAELKEKGIIK